MSHTISFRLDDHYLAKLDAKMAHGASIHEKARRVLLDVLDGEGEVRGELTDLSEKIDSLHDDLALAVEAILIAQGNYTAEKARDWVNRNLRER